jgi:hypothetical protein
MKSMTDVTCEIDKRALLEQFEGILAFVQSAFDEGATRPARLDQVWDRDRKDMTSGREKPEVCWAAICWALPSKNMNQTSFWLNS